MFAYNDFAYKKTNVIGKTEDRDLEKRGFPIGVMLVHPIFVQQKNFEQFFRRCRIQLLKKFLRKQL